MESHEFMNNLKLDLSSGMCGFVILFKKMMWVGKGLGLGWVEVEKSLGGCSSSRNIFDSNEDFVGETVSKRFSVSRRRFDGGDYGEEMQDSKDYVKKIATLEDVIRVKEIQLEIQPSGSNRKKLHLSEITTEHGEILNTSQQIGKEAEKFFTEQFKQEQQDQDFTMLHHIPKMITNEQNEKMTRLPSAEEVKYVVFELNGDSAGGLDGFSGEFFQCCWDIVGEDITRLVRAFFCGQELPKFKTHTNLVLLPKKEKAGFVKGRNITENVLLAQEIIRDINLRKKNINVVVKLDMTKAYDRVSWIFLTKVLRSFGFSEIIVDMVWRLISNNWYSVLINGQFHGLFHSTRGVKQGDPISPTLFIIAAEVLSIGLNNLHKDDKFKGYGMPKWSPEINHLSYADDTILFCSGDRTSIIKMMRILRGYEKISGQLINKAKSAFYLHDETLLIVAIRLRKLSGIRQGNFPFIYLGCPVFYGRKNKTHFEDLVRKVARRVLS
ncbi:hypothetical protein MTR67_022182 [Solanum verrucosum]|uniref:Reverse transcriptase domain-containing protein n=1 Tax=Solanum verrucosum TaxID=315347 RepID=A0AAF0QRE0_SOLVR|nr:hypothetical protein MTR67_022182 [Solanum verrucosum]